jgi:hypothetical protein
MATAYLLADNPKWYFANLVGLPLGGGTMYTYNSQNKSQQKPVFEDPGGNFPWTNPILIDENGTQGPFYFANDVPYYIEVYDSAGVLQWTIDNFTPPAGGGGNITEAFNLTNLIVNNVFWRNIGQTANPIGSQNVLLCPGAHANFGITTNVGNQGDIRFLKSNLQSSDQIQFVAFPTGVNALNGDVTPAQFLRYNCGGIGAGGETYKYIQYPISTDLESTSNQSAIVTIWARCNSGNNQLQVYFSQFFGDGGGASPIQLSTVQTITLTSSWAKYSFSLTIPNISGKTFGACNNSALYLQVQYPLSQLTQIDHVKPCVYLSTVAPALEYLTNDQIEATINTPRTGDARISLNSFVPFGWVAANDGTIGSASSNASNRANTDTFPLYDLIWNSVSSTQLNLAPIFDSSGNSTTLGASSAADFAANKQLALTKALGQVLAGTVPSSQVPAAQTYTVNTGVSTSVLNVSNTVSGTFLTGSPVVLTNSGGAAPTGLTLGYVYYAIYGSSSTLQLALTLDDAIAGNFVTFSTNGSGTNSIQLYSDLLAKFQGQKLHTMLETELAAHNHPGSAVSISNASGISHSLIGPGTAPDAQGSHALSIATDGSSTPFNIMQPTTFMNVFLKL